MKLKEVADLMGVSERTVRNYSAAGKLTPTYVPGKTSPVAEFDEDEVRSLKSELSATMKPERVKVEVRKPEVGNVSNQLAVIPKQAKPEVGSSGFPIEQLPALAQALANVIGGYPSRESLAQIPLLTFAEAAEFTGISEKLLREASRTGGLKARKIGRAQRIRQSDLTAWIDSQFS